MRILSRPWPDRRNASFPWWTWRMIFTLPISLWHTFLNSPAVRLSTQPREREKDEKNFSLFCRDFGVLSWHQVWLFFSSDIDRSIHGDQTRRERRSASPSTSSDVLCPSKTERERERERLHPHCDVCLKTILDRIHKTVNEKIQQSSFVQRHLFSLSYKIKVKRLELGLPSPHLDQ